jgi:beta-lactamase superfamily II metal-dependent hydrolase
MRIDIHDVGHGHCAVVTAPDGTRIMIDCGSDGGKAWWPSIHYYRQYIDLLVLQNLDEDHVQDLPDMWSNVTLGGIFTNPTISAPALRYMKPQGMRAGVEFTHRLLNAFQPGVVSGRLPLDRGGPVSAWSAWNRYGDDFTDTNNLSVATFVTYGSFTALFTGDLEKAGWRRLLTNPLVRRALPSVKVLVASHHGRESGCSDEAFALLRPEVVVFSDDDIQYETQNTVEWYRRRVIGIPDLTRPMDVSSGQPRRRVLTTRRDGSMTLKVNPSGNYVVSAERDLGSHFSRSAGRTLGVTLDYLPNFLGESSQSSNSSGNSFLPNLISNSR